MENKLERLSTPPDKFLIAVIKAVKTEVEEIQGEAEGKEVGEKFDEGRSRRKCFYELQQNWFLFYKAV